MISEFNPAVLVPMAGHSSRFFDNGFTTYKAFLKIAGKTMLEGVLEPFGQNAEIFIITTKELISKNLEFFSVMPNNCTIITIQKHKLGPAYSIYLARDLIPKNKSYFIAYCDVWWRMDAFDILSFIDVDAAILIHEGFHPHLVADNFSAFCCPKEDNPKKLKQIKEKGSFTNDWMDEALSVGVFYCRDTNLMLNAIEELINAGGKVADEFYPSMIFQLFVEQGVDVSLVCVDSFAHLGLPQHFNDIDKWNNHVQKKPKLSDKFSPINCVLLGGKGSRMRSISQLPKHLLPLDGETMLERVLTKMNCRDNIVICAPDTKLPSEFSKKWCLRELQKHTDSHLETMKMALDFLPANKPVLFSSCDCFAEIDWMNLEKISSEYGSDCIVFSFPKSLLNSKASGHHTTMKIVDGNVVDIDIKGKTTKYSDCLAGFFWFRSKEEVSRKIFSLECSHAKEELLVDHLIQALSKTENKPKCIELTSYIHVGTPDEYKEYVYWNKRAKPLISNSRVKS